MPPDTLDLAYNEFYAAIKSWGRYEVVTAPSDADLVFEIRFHYSVGPTDVVQGSGGSTQDFQLRVSILDSRTRTILWALSKSIPQSNNKLKSRQFFDQTMAALVDNLEKLATHFLPRRLHRKTRRSKALCSLSAPSASCACSERPPALRPSLQRILD
jgi:hypothetical protein